MYCKMHIIDHKIVQLNRFNPTSQVEKSEARKFLQPAQYCASCIRGVMPVLPVDTVPNIGILLVYYWRGILW